MFILPKKVSVEILKKKICWTLYFESLSIYLSINNLNIKKQNNMGCWKDFHLLSRNASKPKLRFAFPHTTAREALLFQQNVP